ncbi:MAG: 5'-nucleotidase [Bacteroidia bacterium]|nr:5'-nucleotidase [Bacteroidia bacterium]
MLRYISIIVAALLIGVGVAAQTNYSGLNISMNSQVQPDARIDSIVRVYADSLTAIMDRPIGYCTETMVSRRPESTLMRFVADVMMAEGKEYAKEHGIEVHDAISVINAGGIRSVLREGEVTVRSIFEISPFENVIVIMELTGKQMRDVVNHIASRGGEAVAGLTMHIDEGLAKKVKISGESIDNEKMYTLITLDYVATGGDQFKCLTQIPAKNTGILFREAIIHYIEQLTAKGEQVVPPMDVRITKTR